MNEIISYSFDSSNILDNEDFSKFLLARESVYAFHNSIGIKNIRKISKEVVVNLEQFTNIDFNEETINFIDNYFQLNTSLEVSSIARNEVVDKLRSINEKGFNLLNIDDAISISSLKRKYKDAAKKCHPDHGGKTESMQTLNNAFETFYEYLLSREYSDSTNLTERNIISFHEFFFDSLLILSYIYGDWYAADKSYEYLIETEKVKVKLTSLQIGRIFKEVAVKDGWLERPVYAMNCCRKEVECEYIEKILFSYWVAYCDYEYHVWIKNKDERISTLKQWLKSYREDGKSYFKYTQKKINIYTKEQAENLLRQGYITDKRYIDCLKRIKKNEDKDAEYIDRINKFIKANGFLGLLHLVHESDKGGLISYPSWKQDRYILLDDSQKAEFVKIFSNKQDTGVLFEKYYKVRLNELLFIIIKEFRNINFNCLRSEIDFFLTDFNHKYELYQLLSQFVNYFYSMNQEECDIKCKLLIELDDPFRTYDRFSSSNTEYGSYKQRIEVHVNYLSFVKNTVNDIVRYKNTGDMPKVNYKDNLIENRKFIKIAKRNALARMREKVIHSTNTSPELLIEAVEPYLVYILSEAKLFPLEPNQNHYSVQDFQIGYDINKLTAAYAKLKIWSKVIYWAELFFSLDTNYRGRSCYSEQQKIRKRLERAKKQI